MKVRATQEGSWPAGVRWSIGKVRDLQVPKGEELPTWLVEVKPKKKTKKDTPPADDAG